MRRLTFFISLLMELVCMGQGVNPTRDVEATDDGIIVTYRFNGGFHQDDPLHPGAKFWKIPGFALNDVAGQPAFPFHWDTFAVPDDCEVSLTLIDSAYTDTLFTLAPAYPPLLMSDTIGYTPDRVPSIVAYPGLYPNCSVLKGENQNYRGQKLARVATMPVQYNNNRHTVRSFSMIKYMVSFTRNGRQVRGRDYASSSSNISISDHFLENTTLNYSLSQDNHKNALQVNKNKRYNELDAVPDNRDYLIVFPSKYENASRKFEEWKRKKGFRTHTLCSDSLSVSDIKRYIMQLYNSSSVNLYYVLFIGKNADIPSYANSNFNNPYHLTDLYYGCMEEEIQPNQSKDFLPSVRRGRLLVSTPTEADIVVDKIIEYESNPPSNPDFYDTGLHCAYFQDDGPRDGKEDLLFVTTSEEIKNNVEAQGKSVKRAYYAYPFVNPQKWNNPYNTDSIVPFELQRPQYSWTGNTDSIVSNINEGRFYVLFSGHGITPSEWFLPNFSTYNIENLSNSNLQPVVISLACQSGKYGTNDCLSESFLIKDNGGGIAVVAPTEDVRCGWSDAFAEGLFNAVWPNPGMYYYFFPNSTSNPTLFNLPVYDLGSVMDFASFFLTDYSITSTSMTALYTKEIFHVFGDPSMLLYTQKPEHIANPLIDFRNDTICIRTTDGAVRFSFYSCAPMDYMIDSFVGEKVNYLSAFDSVYVCIDRHNYIPIVFKLIKDHIIQNETISEDRVYQADTIKVGRQVTIYRPIGDVIIDGANVKLVGYTVELHPGTTIINSNVEIGP